MRFPQQTLPLMSKKMYMRTQNFSNRSVYDEIADHFSSTRYKVSVFCITYAAMAPDTSISCHSPPW